MIFTYERYMLKAISKDSWDFATAAHLLNRAGFGGSPAEIDKLADLDRDAAISSLLDYEYIYDPTPDPFWAKPDTERLENLRAAIKSAKPDDAKQLQQQENRLQNDRMIELRGWWLNRMAKGQRPLQ